MRRFYSVSFSFLNILALLALALAFPAATWGAERDGPDGVVETAAAGCFAIRGGREIALEAGSEVYEFDILATDSTGSAIIRFADDSVLEMKSDTSVNLKEVVFSADRIRFNVGLANGAARIITGTIVKINPKAFKMTTPKATIGIRGTTLYAEVSERREFLSVEDLSAGSRVTVTNSATRDSYTMTAIGDSVTISSVERTDPVSGTVTTGTETSTQGGGVFEGDRDPAADAGGDNEKGSQPPSSPHRGDRGGGHAKPVTPSKPTPADNCCNDNSVPGRPGR